MELEINQKKHRFLPNAIDANAVSRQLSVKDVVEQLYPDGSQGIAVALWDRVIARADWAGTFLQDADRLLVITATQGG